MGNGKAGIVINEIASDVFVLSHLKPNTLVSLAITKPLISAGDALCMLVGCVIIFAAKTALNQSEMQLEITEQAVLQ